MPQAALRLYPGAVTFHGRAELQGVEWGERRVTVRLTGRNGEGGWRDQGEVSGMYCQSVVWSASARLLTSADGKAESAATPQEMGLFTSGSRT